jgi:hypothetical protein
MVGEHFRSAGHGCRGRCPDGKSCMATNGFPCSASRRRRGSTTTPDDAQNGTDGDMSRVWRAVRR